MTDLAGHYGVVHQPGILSDAITAVTHHWANHAFLILPGDLVLDSWFPRARINPISRFKGMRIEINTKDRMTPGQRKAVVAFAMKHLKHRYDILQFAGLAARHILGIDLLHHIPTKESFICSRLVAEAGAYAGLDWTSGEHINRVTPASLALRLDRLPNKPLVPTSDYSETNSARLNPNTILYRGGRALS